jgi:Peptidase_C39 like family
MGGKGNHKQKEKLIYQEESMVVTSATPAASGQAFQPMSLLMAASEFNNDPQQIKLIRWLQSSTGQEKQAEFALMWRDGEDRGAIDFVQVFQSYKAFPHQNAALNWLQQASQAKTLEGFFRMWQEWQTIPQSATLRLKVPYYQQIDNRYEPMRTCNTSSCAMVARFLGAKISGDDEYYKIVRKYGDTTDHTAQTKALADIGIKSSWHTNLGFEDLDRSLEAGLPIVIGILHRGTLRNPIGGHMIVVIGRTGRKDYICHDPFGSLLDPGGGYTGPAKNGNGVVYPRHILNYRWLPESENSGWGRLFRR